MLFIVFDYYHRDNVLQNGKIIAAHSKIHF